jgi:DNA-binding response OmpR family regulator
MMKILIIEDNRDTADFLKYAFSAGWLGAQIISAYSGAKGTELSKTEFPDVVLLDLGLPDISGFDVIKKIREFSRVPIVILTVMDSEPDIVKAMELGADEYIVKPVGQMEIIARIKALVRRLHAQAQSRILSIGSWKFNPEESELFNDFYKINLTSTENAILQKMSSCIGKVVTYHELAESVWGIDYPDSINALRVHVSRLRQKMEKDPGYPPVIIAKVGIGYYLEK